MKKKIFSLCFSLLILLFFPTFAQGPGEPYHPMTAPGARHIHRINNQYFGHKLFWENPSASLYNDIYFSQDSNLVITLDSTALILSGFDSSKVYNEFNLSTIGMLENHTKYYWCIVEHNSTGTTEGPVWYFVTESQGLNLWVEDFNNGLDYYTRIPTGGYWSIGNTSFAGGTIPELMHLNFIYTGTAYLILNDYFDLSPSLNPFSFMYSFDIEIGECEIGIAYSLDEGNTWIPFWHQNVTEDIPATQVLSVSVPNENYVKLALFSKDINPDSEGFWFVDNILMDSPLTIPTPPAQIQARADTSSLKVFLSWTPGFAVDPITGYNIQRKVGLPNSLNEYQIIAGVGNNALSYEDLTVQPNTIYTYRIQTVILGGIAVTVWSNEATAYVPNIVPVELQSFTAALFASDVKLDWSTATETNNQGFEIERLQDSKIEKLQDWDVLGFVPGFGTTTEVHHYSFMDESLQSGDYQYRLKQIDFDGTIEYSNIIEVTVAAPKKFALEQNYPNPFNPTTKIEYSIADVIANEVKQSRFVTLKVYDILGNEVAILANEQKPTGTYEVEFDGTGFPSGFYFYQLKAGSFIETKKMVLIK